MRRFWATAVLGILNFCLFGRPAFAAPACQMIQIGELPVTFDGRQATVEAEIDGRPVQMLVDSGSAGTILVRPAAERLGLSLKPVYGGFKFYGVGGGDSVAVTRVREFKISNLTSHDF